jgi:hypothetical protein
VRDGGHGLDGCNNRVQVTCFPYFRLQSAAKLLPPHGDLVILSDTLRPGVPGEAHKLGVAEDSVANPYDHRTKPTRKARWID